MNGIVTINNEEYHQVYSGGMLDFTTSDKSLRILAFPEGGVDYYDVEDENQCYEITLYRCDNINLPNVPTFEYLIEGLYTLEQYEIIKKNYVVEKTFTHDFGSKNDKLIRRELKAMLLIES